MRIILLWLALHRCPVEFDAPIPPKGTRIEYRMKHDGTGTWQATCTRPAPWSDTKTAIGRSRAEARMLCLRALVPDVEITK